jgi:hypothetical protein
MHIRPHHHSHHRVGGSAAGSSKHHTFHHRESFERSSLLEPLNSMHQSTHRSIFLAGGGVTTAQAAAGGGGLSSGGKSSGGGKGSGGNGTSNGVEHQHLFSSGRRVELILGARLCAATAAGGAFEYLVKWVGHAHIHNAWMEENSLDQLAPAELGEYLLQHGGGTLAIGGLCLFAHSGCP